MAQNGTISYPTLALIRFRWWRHEFRRGCCPPPAPRHQALRLLPASLRAVKVGCCLSAQGSPSLSWSTAPVAVGLSIGGQSGLLETGSRVLNLPFSLLTLKAKRKKKGRFCQLVTTLRNSWGSSLWATFYVVHRESGSVPPIPSTVPNFHLPEERKHNPTPNRRTGGRGRVWGRVCTSSCTCLFIQPNLHADIQHTEITAEKN